MPDPVAVKSTSGSNANQILLHVDSVCKRFPGVVALDNVDMSLRAGEVLAVIGENGAGKSTLMKILGGIQTPDSGTITLNQDEVHIANVAQASELRIALIHQELNLCGSLSIGANIFLGREPRHWSTLDHETIRRESAAVLQSVGLYVDPDTRAEQLTIGQQQMVEIAKAISTDARIMIMDEPTSSLSQQETENLYVIIDKLKERGVSVIYISHRLAEVKRVADRVVVLRDGQNAGELQLDEINHDTMVEKMVGRSLKNFYVTNPNPPGESRLQVTDLRTSEFPHCELTFEIRAGEIVGIAGLVGAGRTELLTTLFGITPPLGGEVRVNGQPLTLFDCRQAIRNGIALVPEDRKLQGIVIDMSVAENLSMTTLESLTRWGWIDRARELELADRLIEKLQIKTPSAKQTTKFLSGGNQQKVVLAKWLAGQIKILLLDEPTRGVDVGAKSEIYQLMTQLAGEGVAILFVSSDLEEVIGMSDRMLVMHEGNIAGTLDKKPFTEKAVMQLATGKVSDG